MNEFLRFIKSKKETILFMDLVAIENRIEMKNERLYTIIGVKEQPLCGEKPLWYVKELPVNNNFNSQIFIDACKVNEISCSTFAGLAIERYVVNN